MQHDGGVLPRFHHLVEVADRTLANRTGQWPVHPHGLVTPQQVPADQIRSGEVVVARDGDQRSPEVVGHRLDETGLATSGWPL